MKSLYQYLETLRSPQIDGHLHVFDHTGYLSQPPMTKYAVGFPDIWLDKPNEYQDMVGLYKKYMGKCQYVKYWCATGLDIDSIKRVYDEIEDISGFGELKLYSYYGDNKNIDKKDIKLAREVCKLSEQNGNLPVYIHYELTKDSEVNKFRSLVERFDSVPIVLCHCGMNQTNHEFAWVNLLGLMENHSNLWTDISWSGAKYLMDNQLLITQLPQDRIIWGSDYSYKSEYKKNKGEKIYLTKEELDKEFTNTKLISSDANIQKLFT